MPQAVSIQLIDILWYILPYILQASLSHVYFPLSTDKLLFLAAPSHILPRATFLSQVTYHIPFLQDPLVI